MSNTIIGLSIDAADAAALAGFWAEALGLAVAAGADEGHAVVTIGPADVSVPRLVFHQVPEGKTVKNRLHLDLAATDWDAEIGRLTGLGATPIRDIQENGARWVTLADPEGNEFDLIRR
jgi:predicted enzyme related to lactoylglutathione lyase